MSRSMLRCDIIPYVAIHTYTHTANLPTNIDFGGFDSSIILILRCEIPRPTGDFPESLSQAIVAGIILVGRFGVHTYTRTVKQLLYRKIITAITSVSSLGGSIIA